MRDKALIVIVVLVMVSLIFAFYRLDNRPRINFQGKSYEVVKVWDKYIVSDNSVYMQVKEIK